MNNIIHIIVCTVVL